MQVTRMPTRLAHYRFLGVWTGADDQHIVSSRDQGVDHDEDTFLFSARD
jgi:hypothetical protein